jgi:RNA polymerase sigma-70 factor (ECF subfamily)
MEDTADSTIDPQELIQKAKAGDQRAFDLIYELYATPLYRYIYFRVSRKEDIEDILQTVFAKAFQSIPAYREQGKSLLAYLYTIARNAIIDHARKKRDVLSEDYDAYPIPDESPSAVDLVAGRHDGKRVRNAILALSEDQREVITLRFIQDLSYREVAELLGKTEGSIRQLQSRGLRELAIILEKNHE